MDQYWFSTRLLISLSVSSQHGDVILGRDLHSLDDGRYLVYLYVTVTCFLCVFPSVASHISVSVANIIIIIIVVVYIVIIITFLIR